MEKLIRIISLTFKQIIYLLFLSVFSPLSIMSQMKVATESQLRDALSKGGEILVTASFNLGGTIDISNDVVLDLGNNTLKRERGIGIVEIGASLDLFKCSGSNVVIKNGSIIARYTNGWAGYVTAVQINGGKTTFINCNITGYTDGLTRIGTALDYNGGSIQVISGTFVGEGTSSTGKGYAFYSESTTFDKFTIGCLVKRDGSVIDPAGKEIDGSVSVSPINYTIKYDSNGKITSVNHTTAYSILNDGEARSLPTAEREHYKFLHWYNNSGDGVNENAPLTSSTFPYINIDGKDDQTITFKAKWEALLYTVHFDTDEGVTIPDLSYTVEKYPDVLPTPTRDGFLFVGWFNGSTPITSPSGFTGNLTFTARWSEYKYTLSYNTNTETAPSVQNYTKATSGSITIPATWERKGYTFKGWYDNAKYEGEPIKTVPCPQDGKNAIVSLTLYAKWEAVPYKLTYTLNGEGRFDKEPEATYTIDKTPYTLPIPKPNSENVTFKGWFNNPDLTGNPATVIEKGDISDKQYFAKWETTYYAICHWKSGLRPDLDVPDKKVSFTKEDEVKLPEWDIVDGYEIAGWCEKGLETPITVIKKGTERDLDLNAKWKLADYTISYETYYGTLPQNAVKSYTIETADIVLPYPTRSGFTFAGWYREMALVNKIEKQPKGAMGNKTYYAKWMAGNLVVFDRPANGTIVVKNGSTEVKSGEKVGAGAKLTITATPDSSIYNLVKLSVNGKDYTSSPQTVEVLTDKGLTISAEFADLRPAASAPNIITTPSNTNYIPAGESVTVSLTNTDNTTTVYYRIDGSTPKLYSQPFQVSSLTVGKTVRVDAIAKKNGCKDGVTSRNITFGKGKVTITFTLPKGVTAINPEGGEVISAVASGGTFEFMLLVEKDYFESLDALKVEANGVEIHPNAKNIYTLSNQTGNVTVKVSGISGITHVVTLKQSANGYICFTGEDEDSAPRTVNHGDRVSVTAKGDADYKFFSWTDGTSDNPRQVLVETDVTIQARFVQDDPGYLMVLPTLPGAKVKPLTGYPTSVKKGGTFKFYISLESDYNESIPEVYANGEKLTVYKDVYSIYNVKENVVISVNGIQLNKTQLNLADNVVAFNMETAEQITDQALTPTTMVYLLAKSPQDKRFSMWNDGKGDNPRIIAVKDAQQLLPLFVASSSEKTLKVDLPLVPGAGIGAVNANAEAVASGSDVQLKLVVLPQYSKSQPIVKVEGKVLEPETSLRASSGTKTLFYNLNKLATDVKVELSGLELNDYMVTLEQTTGGSIRASKSGSLKHGTVITLDATPSAGNLFLQWNDGNTMNPYTYTITGDCMFSARFGNASIPLDNESIGMDGVRYYVADGILYIEMDRAASVHIWTFGGLPEYKATLPEGNSTIFDLQRGEYVMKVGDGKPMKVVIR